MKPARSNVLTLPQETESIKPQQAVSQGARRSRFKVRNIVLFGFMAWAAYVFIFVQMPDLNRLDQEQVHLNAEIEQVKHTNADLQKKIDRLHEPDYIAEIARQKYMMVKPGETLFVESKQ